MSDYISTNPPSVNPKDLLLLKRGFMALCTTRAYRYREGELTLHEAVDFLQEWAEKKGLIEACGQDTIQAVITRAFAGVNP